MTSVAAIISTISGAVGVLKEIASLAKKAGNQELNQRIIDLQSRIIEIQAQVTEMANENEALRRRNSELIESQATSKDLVYEESVLWRIQGGKRTGGPFCPNCWEDGKKLIHLTPGATKGTYSCGVSGHSGFRTAEYRDAGPAIASLPNSPRRGIPRLTHLGDLDDGS